MKIFSRKFFFVEHKQNELWIRDDFLDQVIKFSQELWVNTPIIKGSLRKDCLTWLKFYEKQPGDLYQRKIRLGLSQVFFEHMNFGTVCPLDAVSFRRDLFVRQAEEFKQTSIDYKTSVQAIIEELALFHGVCGEQIQTWLYQDIPSIVPCIGLLLSNYLELVKKYCISVIAPLMHQSLHFNIKADTKFLKLVSDFWAKDLGQPESMQISFEKQCKGISILTFTRLLHWMAIEHPTKEWQWCSVVLCKNKKFQWIVPSSFFVKLGEPTSMSHDFTIESIP